MLHLLSPTERLDRFAKPAPRPLPVRWAGARAGLLMPEPAAHTPGVVPPSPGDVSVTAGSCFSCERNADLALPPRERIYDDGLWRIAHAFNATRLGWLVLVLRRHARSLGELTPAEAAVFGHLVPASSRALEPELGVSKAYVMFLAELERFEHVHVHVVARPPVELRGTQVFELLKRPREEWVTDVDMDAFAARIGDRLAAAPGD